MVDTGKIKTATITFEHLDENDFSRLYSQSIPYTRYVICGENTEITFHGEIETDIQEFLLHAAMKETSVYLTIQFDDTGTSFSGSFYLEMAWSGAVEISKKCFLTLRSSKRKNDWQYPSSRNMTDDKFISEETMGALKEIRG